MAYSHGFTMGIKFISINNSSPHLLLTINPEAFITGGVFKFIKMSLDIYFQYNHGKKKRKIVSVIYKDDKGHKCRIYESELSDYFSKEQLNNLEFEEDIIEIVFNSNITHNLIKMADEAGIYEALWRPYRLHPDYANFGKNYKDESTFEASVQIRAKDIIPLLEKGLLDLKNRPEHFKKFNAPNAWGTYKDFVLFVSEVLQAAKKFPDSLIHCCR